MIKNLIDIPDAELPYTVLPNERGNAQIRYHRGSFA